MIKIDPMAENPNKRDLLAKSFEKQSRFKTFGKISKKFEKTPSSRLKCAFIGEGFSSIHQSIVKNPQKV